MGRELRVHDLLIIGGGINGAGIAADAAGRGLDVVLCEAGDLAGATSSASSKLIHGGLRYLEHYDFGLVRKALGEREVLLRKAPHIAWPLRFVLPHSPEQRPRWMIRTGLFLYDHLARRRLLPGSSALNLSAVGGGAVFKPPFNHGFTYWDCWVDDARLVVLNARAAAMKGGTILTRTKVAKVRRADGAWLASLVDARTGQVSEVAARVIVNAAGPWAGQVLANITSASGIDAPGQPRLMLVKGSHIVVPRLHGLDDALILQNPDGRVVFVLPYEQDFSLIGTTDVAFDGDPRAVTASEDEISYLLAAVSRYVTSPPGRNMVVHSFAGVRPLYEEDAGKSASAASRDYVIHTTNVEGAAPILSVLGGKITTYRQLAEAVLDELAPYFPGLGPAWTATSPLPGGDIENADFAAFLDNLVKRRPELPRGLLAQIARRHGSLTEEVLGDGKGVEDLGQHYGHSLYEREVRYLVAHEWASTSEDILWRRTKAGLHMNAMQRAAVADALDGSIHTI
ncbi:MAG: glycerol-3-phosphate dehydrogenase [Hyphomicrobiaceae bacterium]